MSKNVVENCLKLSKNRVEMKNLSKFVENCRKRVFGFLSLHRERKVIHVAGMHTRETKDS